MEPVRNCSSCAHRNPDDVERCVHCGTLLDAPGPAEGGGLEAELRPLLREGRLIEAIRIYRERTGKGLAEAKAAVDVMQGGGSRSADPESGSAEALKEETLESEILPLLKQGRKIEAIKIHRERTGAGLKALRSGCLALFGLFLFQ